MRKKFFLFIGFVLVFALVLSGCSSSTGGKANSNQIVIKLGYFSSSTTQKQMDKTIKAFENTHPNIKIETETAPWGQFFSKLDTEIAAGNQPDVWLSDGVYVSKFAQRGATRDLTSWINRDLNKDKYYGLEFNKDSKGRYWGVPEGIQIAALFYNKDLFDKAHVSYPTKDWTYDDLMNAAAKLTLDTAGRNANDPNFDSSHIKQYGYTVPNITEGWFPILKAFGGGVLDKTMTKSIVYSDANKKAVNWIADGMKKGIIISPERLKSFQSPFSPFPSGSVAMATSLVARTIPDNQANVNYDITILPKGPGGRFAPVIANSWVISKKTSDQKAKAAWEWIKYWVQTDSVQEGWAKLGEAVPVKKSIAQTDAFLKVGDKNINKQAFLDSFAFAGSIDPNPVWAEWQQKFVDDVFPAFNGNTSADQALKKADQDITKVLNDFYKNK